MNLNLKFRKLNKRNLPDLNEIVLVKTNGAGDGAYDVCCFLGLHKDTGEIRFLCGNVEFDTSIITHWASFEIKLTFLEKLKKLIKNISFRCFFCL